jgi:NADPH-dependent F420 reductase
VPIAVIGGTGDEGFGLALRLALAGEDVVIGSRAEDRGLAAGEKATQILQAGTVSGTLGSVGGTSNERAAADCDPVFVTVPFAAQSDIYRSIASAIQADAVVCDTTTPLATAVGGRPWQVLTPWAGSAAEQAKALLPTAARLVAGFHTVSAEALQDLAHPMEGDVLLCGADLEAKARIGGLVERIPALRWVDAGPLSMARIIERLTALMVQINRTYGLHEAGVAVTGRDSWGAPPPKKPRG